MICDGSILPISQYDVLFSLIGTTYGGDGQTTFALPDLRSRVPLHQGQGPGLSNYVIGQNGGVETVILTAQQIPQHTHPARCNSSTSNSPTPAAMFWGTTSAAQYAPGSAATSALNPATAASTGGSQPHDNLMPYLGVNFIISLFGIYPSQT